MGFLAAILDFVKETEKNKTKITRQIRQGQYAYRTTNT